MNTHTSDQPTVADDPKAREALTAITGSILLGG